MTYTVLPNTGQSLGVTRVPINTNFSLIQSVFAANHVGFNNSGAGKHIFVQIPTIDSQAISPPATTATEGALYSKVVNVNSQAFWRFKNSGTSLQLTNNTLNLVATPGAVALMGGMTLMWGNAVVADGGTVTFFTPFVSVVHINVQIIENSTSRLTAYVRSFTQSNFVMTCRDANGGAASFTIYWMAFGFL